MGSKEIGERERKEGRKDRKYRKKEGQRQGWKGGKIIGRKQLGERREGRKEGNSQVRVNCEVLEQKDSISIFILFLYM